MQFHYQLVDLFKGLRDRNAEYHIPGTHACIAAFSGLSFTLTREPHRRGMIVSKVEPNQLSPGLQTVSVGDALISIDGDYRNTIYASLCTAFDSPSPTPFYETLALIDGKTSRLPPRRSAHYSFVTPRGRNYAINLPWIAEINDQCLEQAQAVTDPLQTQSWMHSWLENFNLTWVPPLSMPQNRTVNPKFFISSANANVKWAIFEPLTYKVGVITLKTFGEQSTDALQIASTVRDLLTGQLAETNSILFDVRSTSGGQLQSAAHLIPQFFTRRPVTPGGAVVSVNPMNYDIFFNSTHHTDEFKRWAAAYNQTDPKDLFTPIIKFPSPIDANRLRPVYQKPVGIFTSIKCYGACEVFATSMRIYAAAQVFGEDGTTGGMSTNPVYYNSFLNQKSPKYFPTLAFANEMPLAAPNFKIGWQRFFKSSQTFEETSGLISQLIILPSLNDILHPNQWSSQFYRIARILLPDIKVDPNKHHISNILPDRVFELDEEECVVCQDQTKDTILGPCGHLCACMACCEKLENCPMCRKEINYVVPAILRENPNPTISELE